MKSKILKKGLLIFTLLLLGIGLNFGIQFYKWQQSMKWEFEEVADPEYISELPKEECKLCGDGEAAYISLYKGQANLGVISLNTFKVSYIGINEYGEFGRLKKIPGNGGSIMMNTGENGFTTLMNLDVNRGYATGEVGMNDDMVLDMERAASHLCTNCLNLTLKNSWSEEPYGVGLINFETGEIRLFSENISGFTLGDYYVSCEARPEGNEEEISEIDILMFYCPDRYE